MLKSCTPDVVNQLNTCFWDTCITRKITHLSCDRRRNFFTHNSESHNVTKKAMEEKARENLKPDYLETKIV